MTSYFIYYSSLFRTSVHAIGPEEVNDTMDRWVGRVALVTGESVGVGAAVVRQLVKNGMKVVGCSRSIEKIEVCHTVCPQRGPPREFLGPRST